jgi:succinoglycan biosynthesis protein ExoM
MISVPHVSVCIATYQRPAMLRRLLQSLQKLSFATVSEPEITLVVVDNDPRATARPIVAEFLSRRYRIRYRTEKRGGISHTRNTAIEASRESDFVAFVDDDEEVSPRWLDEMLTVQAALEAMIVAGPVLPRFLDAPPKWMLDGKFWHRRRHKTGTKLTSVGAGNVLIARPVLQVLSPVWFDPRFAKTGGEDTHFFRRCAALGFPVTWADDAVVHESVPAYRTSEDFLIARARNGGNHWTRVDLELSPTLPCLGSRFAVGLFRIAQGTAVRLIAPLLAPARQLRGQMLLAEGMGNLQAFLGHSSKSYGQLEP